MKLFEFGPVVQEEMQFNNISYLELWQPLCSVERNHCAILVEGIMIHEEKICEIILNLD